MNQIERCPFCHCEVLYAPIEEEGPLLPWNVLCDNCGAQGPDEGEPAVLKNSIAKKRFSDILEGIESQLK